MRVILLSPSLPENLGMVARAMRAFDYHDLVVVNGVSCRHPQALASATGAEAVLAQARQLESLTAAFEGVKLAIGTTSHHYDRPDLKPLLVRDAARLVASVEDSAWLFGPERQGLTMAQLLQCHQVARIPTPGPCLNLAQAAAICLYETRLNQADPGTPGVDADPRQLRPELLCSVPTLADWLVSTGLAHVRDASSKSHSLLALASRLGMDRHEEALVKALLQQLRRVTAPRRGCLDQD